MVTEMLIKKKKKIKTQVINLIEFNKLGLFK